MNKVLKMAVAKKPRMFSGNRTLTEIKRRVLAKRGQWNQSGYDDGGDFIVFHYQGKKVLYNAFNGRFMIQRSGPLGFITEASTDLDGVPWYEELLDLLYVGAKK